MSSISKPDCIGSIFCPYTLRPLQHAATHCTATYYNTLQHTTTHYSTLQHTATHYCNESVTESSRMVYMYLCICVCTLQTHVSLHSLIPSRSALQHTQHTATHSSSLQCLIAYRNTLQQTVTHFKTLQCTAAHCNTLRCNTLLLL